MPPEVLLVLVGDMVTEEALPTYLTLLNTLEGTDDPTGAVDTAWGRWSRQWTAEENRHGDLLNRYLYLGGQCNMKSIEQTIMRLISSGFDPDTRSDPLRSKSKEAGSSPKRQAQGVSCLGEQRSRGAVGEALQRWPSWSRRHSVLDRPRRSLSPNEWGADTEETARRAT